MRRVPDQRDRPMRNHPGQPRSIEERILLHHPDLGYRPLEHRGEVLIANQAKSALDER